MLAKATAAAQVTAEKGEGARFCIASAPIWPYLQPIELTRTEE
jgi:hypothetical protein